MATLGNIPRPGYVYDTETDTWVPIGVGAHTHAYIPNTLVDAKGDILTATADNVPARLAKGSDGTVLVSDSTTSTGLAWQPYAAPVTAGKNFIINGGLDFWQRGTTASGNFYSADRWKPNFNSQRYTDAPIESGLTYSLGPVSSQSSWVYQTTIELPVAGSLAPFNSGVWTFSFYAKVDSGQAFTSQAYACNDAVGTNQAAAFMTGSHIGTGAWQRYSVSGTASAINAGNACIRVVIYNLSGSTNAIVRMTGAQFELGSIATPFSRAGGTIQGELAACQRYYVRYTGVDYTVLAINAYTQSTTQGAYWTTLPVPMRVNPTSVEFSNVEFRDSNGGSAFVLNAISIVPTLSSQNIARGGMTISSGTWTTFRAGFLEGSGTPCYLAFSAEL
jgi:hypothetical protein